MQNTASACVRMADANTMEFGFVCCTAQWFSPVLGDQNLDNDSGFSFR